MSASAVTGARADGRERAARPRVGSAGPASRFVARRALLGLLVLWATCSLVFLLVRVASPDPARVLGGARADEATLTLIRQDLGLDRPLYEQYVRYLGQLATGGLGRSYVNDSPVWPLLRDRLPTTLTLVAGGLVLWLIGGTVFGVLAATRPRFDRLLALLLPIGLAIPAFVLGMLLLAVLFGWAGDLGIHLFEPGPPLQEHFWKRIILPWVTLAFLQLATYTRLTRSAMLDVLDTDYLRTARAKGLPESRVLYGHGLRAALTPVVGQIGVDVGALLGGSVVTEKVFGLQGIGQLVVDSISLGDAPVILGVVLLTVTGVVLAGFLTDLAYAAADPRVRLR